MNNKKFAIQFAALVGLVFAALAYSTGKIPSFPVGSKSASSSATISKTSGMTVVTIGSTKINVDVADTPEKRQLGLGGRDSLAADSGMLFKFDKPGKFSFWMKGMKFPLDFIWISNNKVVDILTNIQPPEPNQKDEALPIYQPNSEVDSVIEVNAGFVSANGINVGDEVKLGN